MANEDNLFKCKRCHAIFIGQEFDEHLCTPPLRETRELDFDYYRITKDEMNREVIMIKSMDGILYYFVKREERESDKVPYHPPPTKMQQPEKTPDRQHNQKYGIN